MPAVYRALHSPPPSSSARAREVRKEGKGATGTRFQTKERTDQPQQSLKEKITVWMLRLFRSLSRFETQDIKTQPQFNHYLIPFLWG